jgi:outer membrane protein OmpA-like peptidoglycan-associated protein
MLRKIALFAAFLAAAAVAAEDFAFSYRTGDGFRVLSTVTEDVYIDRVFSYRSEFLNRIAFSVKDTRDGSGLLEGTFASSERRADESSAYLWSAEYPTSFWRDAKGRYDIDGRYFMPTVRNVPVFPDRDLAPGDTWSESGSEVQDFREGFGISEPFVIPFDARYEYRGKTFRDGKEYDLFAVSYEIFYSPPPPATYVGAYPESVMGYSDQLIYWDPAQDDVVSYSEEFRFAYTLSDAEAIEFRGTAEANVYEAERMDRTAVSEDIRDRLESMDMGEAAVATTEKGVTISLSDIKFRADSAEFLPGESEKLAKIGGILKGYPDRDLLIEGHTALAGTAEGRQKLSEDRARAVGDYFIADGIRSAERIMTRGYGAEKPVADNATEEGKSANRRVEITLLEN